MCLVVLLLLLCYSKGLDGQNIAENCNIVTIHDKYYDKQTLFDGYGVSYFLVMHEPSGDLFFSRASHSDDLNNREIMACHIQIKTCRNVEGISKGHAVAYDGDSEELFFGCNDGIYKYDFERQLATRIAAEGKTIWCIYIIEKFFYFIVHPTMKLYVVENQDFGNPKQVVSSEVDNFFVSKSYVVYFSNDTALYKVETPAEPNKAPIILDDKIHVRQFAENSYDDVYFCAYEGIYVDEKTMRKVKSISNIVKPFGMTFYEDDVFYSDKKAIYRLVFSENDGCIRQFIQYNNVNATLSLRLQILL